MYKTGLENRKLLIQRAIQVQADSLRAVEEALAKNETVSPEHNIPDIYYGPDNVFLALHGECVKLDMGEYTYEYCVLKRATQIPNKGGSSVDLGNFDEMVVNQDGSVIHRLKGGHQCWNGPHRTTNVKIFCGNETKILKVSEPQKCAYEITMLSPAVCQEEVEIFEIVEDSANVEGSYTTESEKWDKQDL